MGEKKESLFSKAIKYQENEDRIIAENSISVNDHNKKTLMYVTIGSIVLLLINIIFAILPFESNYYVDKKFAIIVYSVLAVCCVGLFLFLKYKKNVNAILTVYFVYPFSIAFCVLSTTFIAPNTLCGITLAILIHIPVLYVDKGWRLEAVVVVYAGVYIISLFAIGIKDMVLIGDEIINVICFCVFGIVIGRIVRIVRLSNYDANIKLDFMAYHDTLTTLKNRRSLFSDFSKSEKAIDDDFVKSIAIVDIDNFKKYNDMYGHQAGDECLRTLANIFKKYEQENRDVTIYRYGGEEFIILFKRNNKEEIIDICNNIRLSLADEKIEHKGNNAGIVTISVGVAYLADGGSREYEEIIKDADKALYHVKENGRNAVAEYSDEYKDIIVDSNYRRSH